MRAFHKLLINTIIADITNMTVWFALVFFVYLETRSVTVTSVTAGLFMIAVALSGFWLGRLVDRHPKKRVLFASGVVSLVIYALGLVLYVLAPEGAFADPASVILWTMVPLLLVGVIAGNVRGIALPTIITLLIPAERRDRANGLAGSATGISSLIVSVISGVLVGLAGMQWVLILAMVMMMATLIHLTTLQIPDTATPGVADADDPPEGAATPEGPPATPLHGDLRETLAAIVAVPGLIALILFTGLNNLLGGVFASLMDAYGLSLVSVETWGVLWAVISLGFIIGGLAVARWGLGANPLRTLFIANAGIWVVSALFTIQPSILLLASGAFIYLGVVPLIEAAEHTIVQKVVPQERQGRVFGFAQSVELAAAPLTAFVVGPITEAFFIPFMTTGAGADLIGGWFGTGPDRGMALVFMVTGVIGLAMTLLAMRTRFYRLLSQRYQEE